MSLFGLFRRKKKEKQPKQNETVLGGGYSADADKVLRQIKGEGQKQEPAKKPAEPNAPDMSAKQYADVAAMALKALKKKKK